MNGHVYGCHRVMSPKGILPQPAWKLDNSKALYDNELLIEVDTLNLDSASFYQLKQAANDQEEAVKQRIMDIVDARGKMHNPETGSGGMLIGTVQKMGSQFPTANHLCVGDKIATLVSLTLTPLCIEHIESINMETGQVKVKGTAILFASGPYAKLPSDIPEQLALALLDVCGAPAQVQQIVKRGQTVLILGAGGKSGVLCTAMAKEMTGTDGQVIAAEYSEKGCTAVQALHIADEVLQLNAQNAVEVYEQMEALTNGHLADVVINCVNVPDTEMATILCTKDDGIAYFFSTQTNFTKCVLGAEGVGKDIQLMMGNGYTKGHAELTLNMVRESSALKQYFLSKY